MKPLHWVWLFVFTFLALTIVLTGHAQVMFFADFDSDSTAVPGPEVNDPANYVGVNALQNWAIGDFAGSGSKALENLSNGCDQSGPTPLPVDIDFSDGIIQAILGWTDNDGLGIVFRQNGDAGYLASFNASETPAVILNLWDDCNDLAVCLQDAGAGCEAAENTLAFADHGLTVDESGGTAYLVRVEAIGGYHSPMAGSVS